MANQDTRKVDPATLPAWAIRLAYRVAQLEQGRAYSVVVVMAQNEPTWMVQAMGKVENRG
jgi:hypothetical protein